MKTTYIVFALFLTFIGVFYLVSRNNIHHVDDHRVTCGSGFYYNIQTASEMDWYDLEKEADKCSGAWGFFDHQGDRNLNTPTPFHDPGAVQ